MKIFSLIKTCILIPSKLVLFLRFIYVMCIHLLPVCMYACMHEYHLLPGVLGGQKRFWIPWNWSYRWLGAAL